jgi:excisionase family DNA binding protein
LHRYESSRQPGTIEALVAAGDQTLEQLPDVLDLRDVADLMHVHQKTIRLMALEGKIPSFRAGRLWRFKKTKIEEWLNAS